MSLFSDHRQSAMVAIWRLGHVVCLRDVYHPILQDIVANKGDNLNRRSVIGKQTRKKNENLAKKKIVKKCYFLNFKAG